MMSSSSNVNHSNVSSMTRALSSLISPTNKRQFDFKNNRPPQSIKVQSFQMKSLVDNEAEDLADDDEDEDVNVMSESYDGNL